MKTRNLILLMIIICIPLGLLQAQSSGGNSNSDNQQDEMRTLFSKNNGKIDHGGWGGFSTGYSKIGGKDAFVGGGRGGWLINHTFTLGFAGYGFFSNINPIDNFQPTIDNYSLTGGYGGLLIEPIIAPFSPVHISIPVIIGGGDAVVADEQMYYGYYNYDFYSPFFALEAGIDLEFNIVKFFRIAIYGSYRYTSNLSTDYYGIDGTLLFSVPENALRGFNAGITFKFGKF